MKIITAINNPIINKKLKERKINIIGKDIQYKEGILETLEKEININYILINENLPGEIEINELIKKISEINNNIKIILFIKDENKNNINNTLIKNKKIKITVVKKNINIENIERIIFEDVKENKIEKNNKIINGKIIAINGEKCVGKSMTILRLANYLNINKNKILIIDYDINSQNICTILGKKKIYIKKEEKYKYKKIIKKRENKKIKKYKFKMKNIKLIKKMIQKINNNIYVISYNKLLNIEIINKFKKYYNYIFIKISPENKNSTNKKIINNSDENLIIIESNLIGIKNTNKIIEKNYKNKKIKIIINKNNKYSIDEKIIKKILNNNVIIGKIKYSEIYNNLINFNFNNNFALNKKIFNIENKKIIEKIK